MMYVYVGIILIICVLFTTLYVLRRNRIIQKITAMSHTRKCCMIENLVYPFGYTYEPESDIFSSALDAWQKRFGYTSLYDKSASHFQMIFHALPIYFDYRGCTWLIEFWKGQYGIHTGAEVGLYKCDRILDKSEYETAVFSAVSKEEMLPLSLELLEHEQLLAHLSKRHWWLTVFCTGHFAQPEDLTLNTSITFRDTEMMNAFVEALSLTLGDSCNIFVCGLTVCFSFCDKTPCEHELALQLNHLLCRLFLWYSRAFDSALDRVLYLFESLPPVFHHVLQIRRYKKGRF